MTHQWIRLSFFIIPVQTDSAGRSVLQRILVKANCSVDPDKALLKIYFKYDVSESFLPRLILKVI